MDFPEMGDELFLLRLGFGAAVEPPGDEADEEGPADAPRE
jgi:hypothetical protein